MKARQILTALYMMTGCAVLGWAGYRDRDPVLVCGFLVCAAIVADYCRVVCLPDDAGKVDRPGKGA